MRLIYYYIHILVRFSDGKTNNPIELTRKKLSKELQCTERNVIHILNNMEDRKWIIRESGKGRGNATVITFHKSIQDMLELFDVSSSDRSGLLTYLDQHDLLRDESYMMNSVLKVLFGLRKGIPDMEEQEHLHIPYFRQFQSFDPSQIERQTERHMVEQIFNTLVTLNTDRHEVEPCIAHYWERDESGKQWTFYLRKGVTFHNGKILDAEDVKFTFERLEGTPAKWMVEYVDKVVCVGRNVIRFHFSFPVFNFPHVLCSPKASILPRTFADKSLEEFALEPIGTGPYKVNTHNKNLLALSVHHNYFKERAHIDEIMIHVMPSVEKYLITKEIEQEPLFYIPFTWDTNTGKGFKNIERRNLSIKYLMWNMRKEKIRSNPLLREKLEGLINKKIMVEALGYPRYEPAEAFCQHEEVDDSLENSLTSMDWNEPLLIMTYELAPNEADIKWIQSECRKQGIRFEVKVVPFSNFFEESRKADLVLSEYVAEDVEEVAMLNLFQSRNSVVHQLLDQENSRTLKDLYEKCLQEDSQEKRLQVIGQMERLLLNNQIVMPLYFTYQKALYHEHLMGISLSNIGLVPFKDLFYRKGV